MIRVRTAGWGPALLGLVAAVAVLGASPAAAEVAADLADEPVVVESGAAGVDADALRTVVDDARDAGTALRVGVLAEDTAGTAEALAENALAGAGGGTVLVVSPDEVAADSDEHSGGDLDRALDAWLDAGEDDVVAGTEAFVGALDGGGFDTSGLPGPLAGMNPMVLLIGGIILFVVLMSLLGRGRRRARRRGYRRGYRRGGVGTGVAAGATGAAIASRRSRRSTGGSRSRGSRGSSGSRSRSRSRGSSRSRSRSR